MKNSKNIQGEIILIEFPYSDLRQRKVRPAVILSNSKYLGNDILVCGISSKTNSNLDIRIKKSDFIEGGLVFLSFIKNGKLVYVEKKLIIKRLGILKKEIIEKVVENLVEIIGS